MKGDLFHLIRATILAERYLFSDHADTMLRERSIEHWQALEGVSTARLISERLSDQPNPVAEVEQWLPDGTPVKAVWAYVRALDTAKLVTIHFFDRPSI